MAFLERKGAEAANATGLNVELDSHVTQEISASDQLAVALKESNFHPITIISLARKLREEKMTLKDELGSRGNWVGIFSDYLVVNILADEVNGAKPNLTEETIQGMKDIINGKTRVIQL